MVRHLLVGCSTCREQLGHIDGCGELHREKAPRNAASFDYSSSFLAAEETLSLFLSADGPLDDPPAALLSELGRLPEEIQARIPPLTRERRALPFFVQWLVKRSFSCRYAEPGEMLRWALMARIAAEACSAREAGSTRKLADLRVRAEAQLANALRVLGRSDEAEAVMRAAWKQLSGGTGDSELHASMLQKTASLLIVQGKVSAALDSLQEASEILSYLGEKSELKKTEVMRATAWHEAGDLEREVSFLERTLRSVDGVGDGHLPLIVRNNLMHAYMALGRHGRALDAFFDARESSPDRAPQDTILLRLDWNEANVLLALGLPERAEPTLSRVRAGFFRQRLLHEFVLTTRDLVSTHHRMGNRDAVEEIIASTTARVHASGGGPEVLQALEQLQLTSP